MPSLASALASLALQHLAVALGQPHLLGGQLLGGVIAQALLAFQCGVGAQQTEVADLTLVRVAFQWEKQSIWVLFITTPDPEHGPASVPVLSKPKRRHPTGCRPLSSLLRPLPDLQQRRVQLLEQITPPCRPAARRGTLHYPAKSSSCRWRWPVRGGWDPGRRPRRA